MDTSLVVGVEDLGPELLTSLLGVGGALHGERVVEVERRPIGMGQVASCYELSLTLADGGRTSVVAKVPSEDPTSLATANAQHLYEREVRFYEAIAPTVRIRTPSCHHAAFDATSGRFVLLLESLAPVAACDQLDGLTVERAALAVDELAGLHAPHWGDGGTAATAFFRQVGDELRGLYADVLPALLGMFLERYDDQLTDAARDAVRWLREHLGTYLGGRDGPTTVVHGDFRTDNLLFGGRGGEVPLATVDWQTVAQGEGAMDLAYLLTTSLDTATRRAHEVELCERYLARLGALGVTAYGADVLGADYARHAFQGVLMLSCAAVLVERTSRGDEMFLTMIERCATAVDDLDARARLRA